jgi:hypothetical protein
MSYKLKIKVPKKNKTIIVKESQNTVSADINEIMTAYFLVDEDWSRISNRDECISKLEERKQQTSEEEFEIQTGRARAMAEETLAWANQNNFDGSPVIAWWTARPGELSRAVGKEVDSSKNPTDILLKFSEDESFLGISAKSTKSAGDIGFKNPGLGTVSRDLNIDLGSYVKQTTVNVIEEFGLPKAAKARKYFIRENPEIKEKTRAIGATILNNLRDTLFEHMITLEQDELRAYLTSAWMNADGVYPYYVKVTGRGKQDPYSAMVQDVINNDKFKTFSAEDIDLQNVGVNSIGVLAGGKKIMKIRFKFESEPLASSMKLSGDPW